MMQNPPFQSDTDPRGFLQDFLVEGRDQNVLDVTQLAGVGGGRAPAAESPRSFLQEPAEAGRDQVRVGFMVHRYKGKHGGGGGDGPPWWPPGEPWPPGQPWWPPAGAALSCRRRGGTASLCGFAEFGSPSSPAKFYRKRAKTGTLYLGQFDDTPCSSGPPTNLTAHVEAFVCEGHVLTVDMQYTYMGVVGGEHQWRCTSDVTETGGGSVYCRATWVNTSTTNTDQPSTLPLGHNVAYATASLTSVNGYHQLIHAEFTSFCNGQYHTVVQETTFDLGPPNTLVNSFRDVWDLAQEYAAGSCTPSAAVDNSKRYGKDDGSFAFPLSGGTVIGAPTDPDSSLVTVTDSQTEHKQDGNASCLLIEGYYWSAQGSIKDDLSVEDTEDDAIARLIADSDWSEWSPGGSGCLAQWESRSSGTSFTYQEADWKVSASGLRPGSTWYVTVKMFRAPFGTDAYVPFQSLYTFGIVDGDGNLDIEGVVPNEKGYDTFAIMS